jgi:hypothetical protein
MKSHTLTPRLVLSAISTIALFLAVGCGAAATATPNPTAKFEDRIWAFTPNVNVSGPSSTLADAIESNEQLNGPINPLIAGTHISTESEGTFNISFARLSVTDGNLIVDAECMGYNNTKLVTRPLPKIDPQMIFKILNPSDVLGDDIDRKFMCDAAGGIEIEVPDAGILRTGGTKIRVVVQAGTMARIAVLSDRIEFTLLDEYESDPVFIGELEELTLYVGKREVKPIAAATFTTDEIREFAGLEAAFNEFNQSGTHPAPGTAAGGNAGFSDIIEAYTPEIHIAPLFPGAEVVLGTENIGSDQFNPIGAGTTIVAGESGNFTIRFGQYSEGNDALQEQAICEASAGTSVLNRPSTLDPKTILRLKEPDDFAELSCTLTNGIGILVDNAGFVKVEGTTIRIVLRANEEVRIAVYQGGLLFTPEDSYGTGPVSIGPGLEVSVDIKNKTVSPPTTAIFSAEEIKLFARIRRVVSHPTRDRKSNPSTQFHAAASRYANTHATANCYANTHATANHRSNFHAGARQAH